jgi:hypothetical protein
MIDVTHTAIEQVEVTYRSGAWEIWCEWPQKTRHTEISTIIRVTWLGDAPPRLVLSSTRLNLLSDSGKGKIGTAMRRVDKSVTDDLIHHIAEDLLAWYRQGGHTDLPKPENRPGQRWLLYPMWPADEGTIVAGGTNTFKSWIGVAAATQASIGHEILRGNTRHPKPTPILYCDWESNRAAFAERLKAVLAGAGLPLEPCVAYRGKLTVPLVDAAETLAEEIVRQGYGGVIIDSLSAAVGGSLVDDDLANQFWNAVAVLRVPALVMAHKSDEAIRRGHKRAFGSVMHENRPRMLWNAQREPGSSTVLWEVVSDNNTGRVGNKLAWRIDVDTVGDDEEQQLEAVTFQAVNPSDVRLAAREGDTLADRIAYAIVEEGPATSKELAEAVGATDASVRKILSRHGDMFGKSGDGMRWVLK